MPDCWHNQFYDLPAESSIFHAPFSVQLAREETTRRAFVVPSEPSDVKRRGNRPANCARLAATLIIHSSLAKLKLNYLWPRRDPFTRHSSAREKKVLELGLSSHTPPSACLHRIIIDEEEGGEDQSWARALWINVWQWRATESNGEQFSSVRVHKGWEQEVENCPLQRLTSKSSSRR